MSEFSEILDPRNFEDEAPVVVDEKEKAFVKGYLKGDSLEKAAEAAGLDFSYAVKLLNRDEVMAFIQEANRQLGNLDEAQKREGVGLLTEVMRTNVTDFIDEYSGEFDLAKLKESRAPVKNIKVRKDKDGDILSTEITFHDSIDALKTLSKMQGWDAPAKVEHSGFIGGLTPDILKQVDQAIIDAEIVEDTPEKEDLVEKLLS